MILLNFLTNRLQEYMAKGLQQTLLDLRDRNQSLLDLRNKNMN
jgi:hypothetical protein